MNKNQEMLKEIKEATKELNITYKGVSLPMPFKQIIRFLVRSIERKRDKVIRKHL